MIDHYPITMKIITFLLLSVALIVSTVPESFAQGSDETLDLSSLLSLFSAHALPAAAVRLNWTLEKQSPTILQFRIYRGYEDVGNFEVLAEVPTHAATDYSFTDTTAQPGVSYYYKVAAAGQRNESVFPVVISATVQIGKDQTAQTEDLPLMILPGKRVSLYVRRAGHVQLSAVTSPPKALVDDSLRPGIYEFDLSSTEPVTLRLHHENGYTAEVTWPIQ
jgi:hypothetical protein